MTDTMAEAEVWTPGEMSRAIRSVTATLSRIEHKLDTRITREDLTRSELAQAKHDALQDDAIKTLEDNYNKVMLLAAGSGLSAIAGLFVALAGRAT